MDGKQKDLYWRIYDEYKANIKLARQWNSEAKNPYTGQVLGAISKLVSACSHPAIWDDKFSDDEVSKIDCLDRIFEEAESPVAVWSVHPATLERIALRYKHLRPHVLKGGLTGKQFNGRLDNFLQDDRSKIVCCSIGACNQALDGLQHKVSTNIFFDAGWKAHEWKQAYGRTARRGQRNGVVAFYHLVYTGTIDERVYDKVQEKFKVHDATDISRQDDILQQLIREDMK